MPKEITHWLIASEVLQQLGQKSSSVHDSAGIGLSHNPHGRKTEERRTEDRQTEDSPTTANTVDNVNISIHHQHASEDDTTHHQYHKHHKKQPGLLLTEATQSGIPHISHSTNKPDAAIDSSTQEPRTVLDTSFDTSMTLLGASYHDIMYYVPRHADTPAFTNAADYLHGTRGEDTFELLRLLARDYLRAQEEGYSQEQRWLRSFLLGALTHYCTDTIFHPGIYWSSGNWHGKGLFAAQRHHRALESALDLYFLTAPPHTLSSAVSSASRPVMMLGMMDRLLQQKRQELSALSLLLARHSYWHHWKSLGTKTVAKAIVQGYKNLATARRWSQRHLANALVRLLEPHLSLRLQSLTALRYEPQWLQSFYTAFPHGDIEFLHPCTGERTASTFDAMFRSAVDLSLQYWTEIEQMLHQKTIPLTNLVGASLEVGLTETPASAMQHFRAKPIPTFW